MSLVSYNELCEFVERGVIEGADLSSVNGTSIDVHLGSKILYEVDTGANKLTHSWLLRK